MGAARRAPTCCCAFAPCGARPRAGDHRREDFSDTTSWRRPPPCRFPIPACPCCGAPFSSAFSDTTPLTDGAPFNDAVAVAAPEEPKLPPRYRFASIGVGFRLHHQRYVGRRAAEEDQDDRRDPGQTHNT